MFPGPLPASGIASMRADQCENGAPAPAAPAGGRTIATKITRRTMLTTVASALPAAALASPSISDPHPDAELLALGQQLDEACAQFRAAGERADELRAKLKARLPAVPKALQCRPSDQAMGLLYGHDGHYTKAEVDLLRSRRFTKTYARAASRKYIADERILGATEDGQIVTCEAPDYPAQARTHEIIAASDEWHPLEEALRRELGLDRAEDDEQATGERVTVLEQAIVASPAASIDGIRLKAQLAHRALIQAGAEEMYEAGVWPHQVTWSIVRDVLALSGQMAS
jgi:hypothetical protein